MEQTNLPIRYAYNIPSFTYTGSSYSCIRTLWHTRTNPHMAYTYLTQLWLIRYVFNILSSARDRICLPSSMVSTIVGRHYCSGLCGQYSTICWIYSGNHGRCPPQDHLDQSRHTRRNRTAKDGKYGMDCPSNDRSFCTNLDSDRCCHVPRRRRKLPIVIVANWQ